jgi:ribonucleotide monophosphatase NagD (HAD superfamily)
MLTVSWKPLPGAVEAVPALRLALLTNTTSRTPSIAGHVRRPVGPRDDVEADVVGGQAAGLTGVLVRTGKFQPAAEEG